MHTSGHQYILFYFLLQIMVSMVNKTKNKSVELTKRHFLYAQFNSHPLLWPPRGSWNVVVLVLWSTKYLTPSAVYLISHPSGRGSSCIILYRKNWHIICTNVQFHIHAMIDFCAQFFARPENQITGTIQPILVQYKNSHCNLSKQTKSWKVN